MTVTSLRGRQAAVAHDAIVDALVRHLEAGDADEMAMEDLAREAGVSRRTLYRYFPTRADLLAAAGDRIRDTVLDLPADIGPEGIAASFRAAAARLEHRPRLARALLRAETGHAARGGYRAERVAAIHRAVRREVPGLSRHEADRAAAVLAYLCSSNAWITMQDESGLGPRSARDAVVWATEILLAHLRNDTRDGADR